jgi:hypothetical protein
VVTVAAATSAAADAPQPETPGAVFLPTNAAIAGTVAIDALDKVLKLSLSSPLAKEVNQLNLPPLRATLKLDPSRSITFALDSLSPAGEEILQRISALPLTEPGAAARLQAALAGVAKAPLRLRVVLPSTDPRAALAALPALLSELHVETTPAPRGRLALRFNEVIRGLFHATHDSVIFDFQSGVATALTAPLDFGSIHGVAPDLEGRAAQIQVDPDRLSAVAAVTSFVPLLPYFDGSDTALSETDRDHLAVEALRQRQRSRWLAVKPGVGPIYNRETLSIDAALTTLEIRFEPGRALTPIPDSVWNATKGLAVVPGSRGFVDVSSALMRAWPMPGSNPKESLEILKVSPNFSIALGAPVGVLSAAYEELARTFPTQVIDRFERLTVVVKAPDVVIGILPATTKRTEALCALAATLPCPKKDALVVGKTVEIGTQSARLLEIDGRFVVAVSDTKKALEKTSIQLEDAPPVRVDMLLPQGIGMRLSVDVGHDGPVIVAKLRLR